MHDLPTEGWTFGMHTFYTQVKASVKMEEKFHFQGGVNFYDDGQVQIGDPVKVKI